MQLHLDTAELNLLADVLLQVKSTSGADDDLLDKILAKDLRLDSDELEKLGDLLGKRSRQLKDEIARAQGSPAALVLQQKLGLLQRVLERVNEACVMF